MFTEDEVFSILPAFGIGMIFLIIAGILVYTAPIPDVYVSYSTGECIEVKSKNDKYSCENLPEKYNHVWVK